MIARKKERKVAFISIVELLQASHVAIASWLRLAVKDIKSCFELPIAGFESLKSILLTAPTSLNKVTKPKVLKIHGKNKQE